MNIFLLIYLALCFLHIAFRSERMKWPTRISKVLIMPSLLMYYLVLQTDNGIFTLLICMALLLGSVGDVLLSSEQEGKTFYLGMLSFFIAHLAYITYFILHLQSWGYFLFAVLVLLIPLYKVITTFFPARGAPIMSIYAATLFVLIAFTAASLCYIAMIGAIFFAISDYLIAMDIVEKRTFSGTTVMATYTLAQLLLIVGILTLQGAL